jgi:hypothetical protein
MRRPRRCPKCHADQVRRIIYGMPSPAVWELAEAGQVLLGGCVVESDQPTWRCLACGAEGGGGRSSEEQLPHVAPQLPAEGMARR